MMVTTKVREATKNIPKLISTFNASYVTMVNHLPSMGSDNRLPAYVVVYQFYHFINRFTIKIRMYVRCCENRRIIIESIYHQRENLQ
jgi:hypothetical protein